MSSLRLLSPLLLLGLVVPALAHGETKPRWITSHGLPPLTAKISKESYGSFRAVVVDNGTAGAVAVQAELRSDAGEETIVLTESDVWLHGGAAVAALPSSESTISVTVYDSLSAPLATFSGTVGADGRVSIGAAEAVETSGDCASRSGCGTSDTTKGGEAPDLELRSARYSNHSWGLAIDVYFGGVDAQSASSASITITEPVAGEPTCYAYDEKGNCLKWGSTTTSVITTAEVGFDDLATVWEGTPTVEPEGEVTMKVRAFDVRGKKVETSSSAAGLPWDDGGVGISTVSTDEDPLTSVGLYDWLDTGSNHTWAGRVGSRGYGAGKYGIELDGVRAGWMVLSEGWTYGDEVPASAQLELSGGEVIPVAVNSYQRKAKAEMMCEDIRFVYGPVATFGKVLVNGRTLTIDDGTLSLGDESAFRTTADDTRRSLLTLDDLSRPLCAEGVCVQFEASEDGAVCSLAVTQYSDTLPFAEDAVEIELVVTDEVGLELGGVTLAPEFDDELSVVFGVDLEFDGSPVGQSISGKLSLLGTPNRKGKASTLAKGKFHSVAIIDEDGWLVLAGVDKDEAAELDVAAVTVGAALTLDEGVEGTTVAPPLAATCGNGSGTKAAAHQASTKPQLL